jgi:hypothetical protein
MAAGCAVDADPRVEPTDGFVFGLSADEVLAAKRVAQQPMSDEAWLDAHRGAFTCDRHGDLCAKIGPVAAARAIELGYRLAIEGADPAEIVRAQSEAAAAARIEWRELDATPYVSDTEISNGTGASGRRLVATASAFYWWPTRVLEADAECSTQFNLLGLWVAMDSDRLCGSMRATYNEDMSSEEIDSHSNTCATEAGVKHFASFVRAAQTLTTRVSCSAEEGLWSASRSADVTETAWL